MVLDYLKKMVYAKNQPDVDRYYNEIKNIFGTESLIDNLDCNWMNIQEQWVQFHRNHTLGYNKS